MNQSQQQQLIEYARKALIFALQLLGNQSEAEDVVQSSVEKVLSHPSAPSGGVDLQKWLYRVVRNAAIDRIRQQAREIEQAQESQFCETLDPEQQLQQKQLQNQVKAALAELSTEQREIIVLRDYHSYSYEDIAEILVIAKGTVMSRLHRARMNLREKLLQLQGIEQDDPKVVVLTVSKRVERG